MRLVGMCYLWKLVLVLSQHCEFLQKNLCLNSSPVTLNKIVGLRAKVLLPRPSCPTY